MSPALSRLPVIFKSAPITEGTAAVLLAGLAGLVVRGGSDGLVVASPGALSDFENISRFSHHRLIITLF